MSRFDTVLSDLYLPQDSAAEIGFKHGDLQGEIFEDGVIDFCYRPWAATEISVYDVCAIFGLKMYLGDGTSKPIDYYTEDELVDIIEKASLILSAKE